MIFSSINSYFSIDNPCLHFEEEKKDFNIHVFYDFPFPILTISIDHLNEKELNVLFYEEIELARLTKNELFLPIWKFGNDSSIPFLFGHALDPNAPQNYSIVDALIQKNYLLVCFVQYSEKDNIPVFKGFRILNVPDQGHLVMGEYFTRATEIGYSYSFKYLNWILNEVKHMSVLERWEQLTVLGKYSEVTIVEAHNEIKTLFISEEK